MNLIETAWPEVLLLEPKVFGGARGQVGWELARSLPDWRLALQLCMEKGVR